MSINPISSINNQPLSFKANNENNPLGRDDFEVGAKVVTLALSKVQDYIDIDESTNVNPDKISKEKAQAEFLSNLSLNTDAVTEIGRVINYYA